MTVSVIVTVYNAQDTLRRCVDSILSQEEGEYSLEVILVDDGSDDGSPGICDEYADKDRRVVTIHQENGGLCRAWNAGVRVSSGDYLAFVDSDDWIDSGMIRALSNELVSGYKGQVICCNALEEHSDGRTIRVSHGAAPGEYTGDALLHDIKRKILGNSRRTVHFSRCLRLVPSELIRADSRYCDPRIRMGEDVNIMLPVLLDCDRLVILPDSFYYHYTYNDSSMAHGYDGKMEDNTDRLVTVMEQVLSDRTDIIPRELGEAMLGREKSCLYMLELKNRLRYSGKDRMSRITEWAGRRNIKEHLRRFPVEASGMDGHLLYAAMKHPSPVTFGFLSAVYDIRR